MKNLSLGYSDIVALLLSANPPHSTTLLPYCTLAMLISSQSAVLLCYLGIFAIQLPVALKTAPLTIYMIGFSSPFRSYLKCRFPGEVIP